MLAVSVCAYLAAVYLSAGAHRDGHTELIAQSASERYWLVYCLCSRDSRFSFDPSRYPTTGSGLAHRGLIFVIVSGMACLTTIGLLYLKYFAAARIAVF